MENLQTKQTASAAGQSKKRNSGKDLTMAGLGLGIIATAFTVICLTMFGCKSTSRQSTPSEIEVQKEFQKKLDAATKVVEQKLDSIKAAEQK